MCPYSESGVCKGGWVADPTYLSYLYFQHPWLRDFLFKVKLVPAVSKQTQTSYASNPSAGTKHVNQVVPRSFNFSALVTWQYRPPTLTPATRPLVLLRDHPRVLLKHEHPSNFHRFRNKLGKFVKSGFGPFNTASLASSSNPWSSMAFP